MVIKCSLYHFQHANEDVERMLLGNKCDMEDKRVVPKAKGEQVRWCTLPASCKQPAHHPESGSESCVREALCGC